MRWRLEVPHKLKGKINIKDKLNQALTKLTLLEVKWIYKQSLYSKQRLFECIANLISPTTGERSPALKNKVGKEIMSEAEQF